MSRTAILHFLRRNKRFLREELGVKHIALFGSVARGAAASGSDVDILVEQVEPDYRQFVLLQQYLEAQFGRKVDLVRRGPHLRESFLESIEHDLVYA